MPYYTILCYTMVPRKPSHATTKTMASAPPSERPYFQEMSRSQYKWELNLSVCVIVCPFVCLFVPLFVQWQNIIEIAFSLVLESGHLFVFLLVCLFACLLACMCDCLSVCLFVCFVCLSVCFFLCLCVCLLVCAVIDKHRNCILTCMGFGAFLCFFVGHVSRMFGACLEGNIELSFALVFGAGLFFSSLFAVCGNQSSAESFVKVYRNQRSGKFVSAV